MNMRGGNGGGGGSGSGIGLCLPHLPNIVFCVFDILKSENEQLQQINKLLIFVFKYIIKYVLIYANTNLII